MQINNGTLEGLTQPLTLVDTVQIDSTPAPIALAASAPVQFPVRFEFKISDFEGGVFAAVQYARQQVYLQFRAWPPLFDFKVAPKSSDPDTTVYTSYILIED